MFWHVCGRIRTISPLWLMSVSVSGQYHAAQKILCGQFTFGLTQTSWRVFGGPGSRFTQCWWWCGGFRLLSAIFTTILYLEFPPLVCTVWSFLTLCVSPSFRVRPVILHPRSYLCLMFCLQNGLPPEATLSAYNWYLLFFEHKMVNIVLNVSDHSIYNRGVGDWHSALLRFADAEVMHKSYTIPPCMEATSTWLWHVATLAKLVTRPPPRCDTIKINNQNKLGARRAGNLPYIEVWHICVAGNHGLVTHDQQWI
jgi:hypothetical protein